MCLPISSGVANVARAGAELEPLPARADAVV
jgi:hypothetical protein